MSAKRNIILFILFLSFSFLQKSFSQSSKADSLLTIIKASKGDTNEVNAIYALYVEIYLKQPDEALQYARQALALSEKLAYISGAANANRIIGLSLYYKGDYDSSRIFYDASLALSKETGDKIGMAKTWANIGSIEQSQGRLDSALHYAQLSLPVWEEIGDVKQTAKLYNNIGNIHIELKNYDKALEYFSKSLVLKKQIDDKQAISNTLNNIAEVYRFQSLFDKALQSNLESLALRKQINDQKGIADCYSYIGNDYRKLDKSDKALEYLLIGFKLQEEVGNKKGLCELCPVIGKLYIDKKDFPDAFHYLNTGLEIGKEIKSRTIICDSYQMLSEAAAKQNNFRDAYRYNTLYINENDSLLNEDKNKTLLDMESKYENVKKQKEIQLLNKDKQIQQSEIGKQKIIRNSFIAGFALILIFSGLLYNRFKIIRTQKVVIEKEKERSDELLLNILPSETAEELKQTGTAKARSYDHVTVMFTDFKNFTQASERMTAEELVKEINNCYSEFDRIITKYGIEKIKTIGDSYMCAGGLPVENKTNPVEVVAAALEIQQFIAIEKEKRQKNDKPYFEIRIGINSGAVVAGIVGIKKFAYDIWGDTVNIASRMESSGEAGKVNISGSTYELVKDKFACTHRGKIDAKNKGMIDMYFVEEKKF